MPCSLRSEPRSPELWAGRRSSPGGIPTRTAHEPLKRCLSQPAPISCPSPPGPLVPPQRGRCSRVTELTSQDMARAAHHLDPGSDPPGAAVAGPVASLRPFWPPRVRPSHRARVRVLSCRPDHVTAPAPPLLEIVRQSRVLGQVAWRPAPEQGWTCGVFREHRTLQKAEEGGNGTGRGWGGPVRLHAALGGVPAWAHTAPDNAARLHSLTPAGPPAAGRLVATPLPRGPQGLLEGTPAGASLCRLSPAPSHTSPEQLARSPLTALPEGRLEEGSHRADDPSRRRGCQGYGHPGSPPIPPAASGAASGLIRRRDSDLPSPEAWAQQAFRGPVLFCLFIWGHNWARRSP